MIKFVYVSQRCNRTTHAFFSEASHYGNTMVWIYHIILTKVNILRIKLPYVLFIQII